jgi:hypothetical protein
MAIAAPFVATTASLLALSIQNQTKKQINDISYKRNLHNKQPQLTLKKKQRKSFHRE